MLPMNDHIPLSDTALIVPAGGSSSRFGAGNKLLQSLSGLPVFLHCIRTVAPLLGNKNIFLAVPQPNEEVFRSLCEEYLPQVEIRFIHGGKTRTESVFNALNAAWEAGIRIAAIHDAARPFITQELFLQCVEKCRETGGALACHKICDTVKQTSGTEMIEKTIPRDNLWAAETPQVFRMASLLPAYEKAIRSGLPFTDDSQVMELYSEIRTAIVENKKFNGKITYLEDLEQARNTDHEIPDKN